jgi:hypothetical protein
MKQKSEVVAVVADMLSHKKKKSGNKKKKHEKIKMSSCPLTSHTARVPSKDYKALKTLPLSKKKKILNSLI